MQIRVVKAVNSEWFSVVLDVGSLRQSDPYQEIEKLGREDALAFYRRFYAPNNASISIAGDIDPARADSMIDVFRMTVQPRLEEIPGFCSASLLVDRSMGRASTSVTYESRDALVRSRQMGLALREETTAAMGASVTEAAEFDLVLAHLRVPEMA